MTPFTSVISLERIAFTLIDAVLLALVIFLILRISCFKGMKFSRTLLCAVFAAYIGIVAAITLFPIFPIRFTLSLETIVREFSNGVFVPFAWLFSLLQGTLSGENTAAVFYNLGGNFFLLMPFGVLVPLIWRSAKPLRIILWAVLASLGLEFVQFLERLFRIGSQNVSFDDFFFNALGCIVAYLLFLGIRTAAKKS